MYVCSLSHLTKNKTLPPKCHGCGITNKKVKAALRREHKKEEKRWKKANVVYRLDGCGFGFGPLGAVPAFGAGSGSAAAAEAKRPQLPQGLPFQQQQQGPQQGPPPLEFTRMDGCRHSTCQDCKGKACTLCALVDKCGVSPRSSRTDLMIQQVVQTVQQVFL